MTQHEATSFSLLYTESLPSLNELRKLMAKTIRDDMLRKIAEFRRDVAKKQEDILDNAEPEDSAAAPYEIRHNIAVDISRFPNFEAALKNFSALCKREGFMPSQRQFAKQGDRLIQRYRTGRFERTVFPVSPMVAATIRDRKRKALRGELDAPARVRPRDVAPPAAVVAPPIVSSETPVAEILVERPVVVARESSLRSRFREGTGPREEVLIFIEFMSDTPKFGIIKDKHKALIGFPFGGIDDPEKNIFGQTPVEGGLRELREEFFFKRPVMLSASEENIIATMPGPEGGTVHIMHMQVPAGTPYAHGEEQTDSALATEEKIDELVRDRLILPKHKEAWFIFKETILLPRFFGSLRQAV